MTTSELMEIDDKYYMPVFGKRLPVHFVAAKDVYLISAEGEKYLDFLAGIAVNALGYSDNGLKAVLKEQIDNVIHSSNYFYNDKQTAAAKLLCEACKMDKVFFSNSGAEANEGAIKLARKYFYKQNENKYKIITAINSFHGRTLATLSATGQEKYHKPFYPLTPEFESVPYNNIDAIKNAVSEHTCAIMLEPILGEGGVFPAQKEYLQAVRKLCDEKNILLIFDEIQSGMGRTGKFLACMNYGVKPDIVTVAKALGSGIPVGAFLSTDKIASAFEVGDHGSTFAGNHLACAAAEYTIGAINNDKMLAHISEMGAYLIGCLKKLQSQYPEIIEDVRGAGLMCGAQIKNIPVKNISSHLLTEHHIIIATAGNNTLRFLPPYIITKEHIDCLIDALGKTLEKIN